MPWYGAVKRLIWPYPTQVRGISQRRGVGQIPPGPAHTHRIPRPVLTPRQGSGLAPLRGVLVAALRPAAGGGVLRRPPDGIPRFLPKPLCPQGP